MKNRSKFLALVLSIIMVCSLCVMFASCVSEEVIQQKQQRIEELQAQLENKQKEIDELKAQLASKQKEIEDLQAQLENKQKEIDELKRENDSSIIKLNRAKEDIKTLVGQLSELVEPDFNTLTEEEEYMLKHGHEPYLEENFKDNIVSVILKSRFIGLIGFEDFAVTNSVSEVIAIEHGLETIYKGSKEKFPIYEGSSKSIDLTLSTHDKAKVLEVIDILQKLDIVLTAIPDYIYIVAPCSVPSDTNYSANNY